MPEERDSTQPDTGADMADVLQRTSEETLTTGGDPLDAGYSPPDRPYAAEDHGVTAAEMHEGETLEQRLRREEPEEEVHDIGRSGRLVAEDTGPDGVMSEDGDARDVGVDGGAASAEEAAMHEGDTGFEPVADDSPAEDPEVAQALAEEELPAAAEADAERDYRDATEPQDLRGGYAASRIDADPDTGGVPGVDGSRDAGVTPGSWR